MKQALIKNPPCPCTKRALRVRRLYRGEVETRQRAIPWLVQAMKTKKVLLVIEYFVVQRKCARRLKLH